MTETRFVTSNKNKTIFEFRSEVDNHFAPNVTLISSDNAKVKGHSIILGSCHYFRELFNKDKTGNSNVVFHENFTGDVLEFVVKYIYTAEYSLLDVDKLPEVIRATSKERFNIPALAKEYLLEQLDAPGGLNQSNWHLFYKNGIKLSWGEEYFNRIYAFLRAKHPEFYKSEEFWALTYEEICNIMSPNSPFESITTIMEATLLWTSENKVGKDKLAELSNICTNIIQGKPNPQTNSSIPDASILSANGSLSTPLLQPTILSDPHCSTRKRTRSISPQINTNQRSKRSNVVEIYGPPKYSWDSAQLLFFGQAEKSEPGYLWSYSFQTGEIKKMAKLPIDNLEFSSLLISQDRIYSIGGRKEKKSQELVQSFPIRDLENLDKAWDKGPNLSRARWGISTLLFRNTIYLFPEYLSYYKSGIEKCDLEGNPGIWENNNWDMLYDRESFGVAFLHNIIYMVGGYGAKKGQIDSQNSTLYTVESYNIEDGTQTLLPNLRQARSHLQVVALKDRIYAIGGQDDEGEEFTSVESYKPGDSRWKHVAQMNHPRAFGSAFVLDDMIYVFGGDWGKPTMERYCPQEDRWTMVNIKLPEWVHPSATALLGPNNF